MIQLQAICIIASSVESRECNNC